MLELTIVSLVILVSILVSASTLTILVDIVDGNVAGAGASDITATVAFSVAADDSDNERHGSLKELLELKGVVPLIQPLVSVPRGGPGRFTGEHAEQETLGQQTLMGRHAVQVNVGDIGQQDL